MLAVGNCPNGGSVALLNLKMRLLRPTMTIAPQITRSLGKQNYLLIPN